MKYNLPLYYYTETGEILDDIAYWLGIPSRFVKRDLFGGDLESDSELRERIIKFIGG